MQHMATIDHKRKTEIKLNQTLSHFSIILSDNPCQKEMRDSTTVFIM